MTKNIHGKHLILIASIGMLTAACAAPTLDQEEEQRSQTAKLNSSMRARVSGTGGNGLRVRAEPNTTSAHVASLAEGQMVTIACQIAGEMRDGTEVWDFIDDVDGYVSDAYLYTGYDGFAPNVKRCDGSGSTSGGGGKGDGSTDNGNGSSSSSSSSSDGMAAKAIAEARSHLGYTESGGKCNWFSSYWKRSGGCQAWCSDFVDYVWMKAGFDVTGITGYSGTIYDYGVARGTTKSRYSTAVRPGDAVLWGALGGYSAHVGMVTAVNGDSVTVIHGNFEIGPGGAGIVHESTLKSRDDQVGTGYGIYAFVSPVPKAAQ
jgi:hypothetical protein